MIKYGDLDNNETIVAVCPNGIKNQFKKGDDGNLIENCNYDEFIKTKFYKGKTSYEPFTGKKLLRIILENSNLTFKITDDIVDRLFVEMNMFIDCGNMDDIAENINYYLADYGDFNPNEENKIDKDSIIEYLDNKNN